MNTIVRNRLIGGVVLCAAALLFIPAILTPNSHSTLKNPDFTVTVNNQELTTDRQTENKENAALSANAENDSDAMGGLQLESLATVEPAENVSANNTSSATANSQLASGSNTNSNTTGLRPIALESLDGASNTSALAPINQKPPENAAGDSADEAVAWVRVGSFADLENATKLASMLKRQNFPVKTEVTDVEGQTYQRVLVGPFTNDDEMQQAFDKIKANGYNPSIQR